MFDIVKALKDEMEVGTHIWISFQTNVIKDFAYGYPDNWEDMVSTFKSKLTKDKWHVPVLTKNLRNSAQVFDMVENLKGEDKEGSEIGSFCMKDSLGIKIMGMTLNATLPKYLPINALYSSLVSIK